ncbi:uncharacterized protein BUCNMO_140 [Buchnera aphidicola (Nipponaphis monzeni)]|uniref:Uncharacterized protein n=1 Tax=Buchnera aphidicola (Nipponaphis monzeni) TaxID=2495405 RepID=A0A455TA13_9GAMM|nr:uncharacterized protein BUCNMO_140 [Buchnera aphidicola (Nipponaphis monzeni)]
MFILKLSNINLTNNSKEYNNFYYLRFVIYILNTYKLYILLLCINQTHHYKHYLYFTKIFTIIPHVI